MFAWGWEAWMDIVRGLRNVSGRPFNASDYREGTVWSSAQSWVLAHLIRWVLERSCMLM
jgi:hypothetical protein